MNPKQRIRRSIMRVYMPAQILAVVAVAIIIASQFGFPVDPFVVMLIVNPLFILAVGCLVYISVFIRCPACQKPIGLPFFLSMLQPSGKWINRDWGLNFCPSCGADYQKEPKDEESSNQQVEGIRR